MRTSQTPSQHKIPTPCPKDRKSKNRIEFFMRLSCGLSPYEGKWGISLPEFPLAPSQNLPLILYCSALLWQLTESAFQTPRERTLVLSHATPTQSQTAREIASRLFCDNVVKKDRVSAWRTESGSNSQGGTPGIVLIPRRASLLPPTSRWGENIH